jgi:hypothetical protein
VTAIAAGYGHSLALKGDGTVVGWGCGPNFNFGQCSAPSGLAHVTAISAGDMHSLAVADWLDQTINFAPLPDRTWGYPGFFVVSATASSGLPVSFAASGNPASDVSRTFTIARSPQSITFAPLADKTYGDPDFTVYASASSGSDVRFAARGNCTLSGTTVHLTGAGSCTVTASEPGSVNYEPAPDVSQTFGIARAEQSILFGQLAHKPYGAADFRVHATASSGLPVLFAARGKCTVRGARVHLTGAGSCELTASQPGNVNYNAADDVSRRFSIGRAPCRVPKVIGKQLTSAERSIAAGHCRTGKVAYASSGKRKTGVVISQSRRPGRVLPANSKINLIVNRGRRR